MERVLPLHNSTRQDLESEFAELEVKQWPLYGRYREKLRLFHQLSELYHAAGEKVEELEQALAEMDKRKEQLGRFLFWDDQGNALY